MATSLLVWDLSDTHRKGNRLDKFILKGFNNIDFTVLHLDFACSDHRPIMVKFPQGSSFSSSRWRFPDWILSVEEVVEDFESLLDISELWPAKAARIRARAINWVKVLLTDESYYSSVSTMREEYIAKDKHLTLNPCAKRTNAIRKLYFGSQGHGSISVDVATSFYKDLYSANPVSSPASSQLKLDFLSIDDIKKLIKNLNNCVSPGPSGISSVFLKRFSDKISALLLDEFISFNNCIDPWWKEGIITLTPKPGAPDLSDLNSWRPISLLNLEYKLFTSLLNREVTKNFGHTISKLQIGFVPKKWIHQHHLTLQAILKNCAGIKGGALFTDFVKAYDTLSHDYIISRFNELGGSSWSSMIALVIGGSSKVWVGGSLGGSFPISRGVRQGDVISPIIFNLCINPLFHILNIPGVYIRNQRFKILAYADDLVFFVNNIDELKKIKILLAEFKLKSGLTVSLTKSKFMPFVAGCPQDLFPSVLNFKYLGIVIDNYGNILFDEILPKLYKKLEACKLSYGSCSLLHRVRIINCYALSMLVFYMRVVSVPVTILSEVKKRVLLSLGSKGSKVGWDRLILPHKSNGYGLIDLPIQNFYMLREWLCYLKDTSLDYFTTLVDSWSLKYSLKYKNKYGGPLLSPRPVIILEEWSDLDLSFSGYELTPSSDIPEVYHIHRLRSCNNVKVNGKIIPFNLEKRKEWRSNGDLKLRLTNGQKRWFHDYKLDIIKLFKVWRRCSLPQYIKCWYFDAMHIILAVLYKKESCSVCGEVIRSHHFVCGCKGITNFYLLENLAYVPVVFFLLVLSEVLDKETLYLVYSFVIALEPLLCALYEERYSYAPKIQ